MKYINIFQELVILYHKLNARQQNPNTAVAEGNIYRCTLFYGSYIPEWVQDIELRMKQKIK